VLQEILGADRVCKCVVVVTDSITINASWYRSPADYFVVATSKARACYGVAELRRKKSGYSVFPSVRSLRISLKIDHYLPLIRAGGFCTQSLAAKRGAAELVRMLAKLDLDLTVTIGRNEELRPDIDAAADGHPIKIIGWTNELPRMMHENHLLIGKAGGATVQETIAAKCPMIINHVVAGQEEGNARLIVETNSGVIVQSPREVVAQVQRAFDDGAKQWREWAGNISKLSRPRAALDIAEFLMSL